MRLLRLCRKSRIAVGLGRGMLLIQSSRTKGSAGFVKGLLVVSHPRASGSARDGSVSLACAGSVLHSHYKAVLTQGLVPVVGNFLPPGDEVLATAFLETYFDLWVFRAVPRKHPFGRLTYLTLYPGRIQHEGG